jgi:hypothetical protein
LRPFAGRVDHGLEIDLPALVGIGEDEGVVAQGVDEPRDAAGEVVDGSTGLVVEQLARGAGRDRLVGGNGHDTFIISTFAAGEADRIEGYERGETIDLSGVLGAFRQGRHDIEDFVQVDRVGRDYHVAIDVDGRGGPAGFVTVLELAVSPQSAQFAQGADALHEAGILIA